VIRRASLVFCVLLGACGVAEQPEWAETVAAYGIETATKRDRDDIVEILRRVAESQGHHVDSATAQELANVYRLTIHACAWKGTDDDETLACVTDFEERPGLVYLTFDKGSEPSLNTVYREAVVAELSNRFGALPRIPQMPNGTLPLARDLVLDSKDYSVSNDSLRKYEQDALNAAGR
jgi:hypothetical protein